MTAGTAGPQLPGLLLPSPGNLKSLGPALLALDSEAQILGGGGVATMSKLWR